MSVLLLPLRLFHLVLNHLPKLPISRPHNRSNPIFLSPLPRFSNSLRPPITSNISSLSISSRSLPAPCSPVSSATIQTPRAVRFHSCLVSYIWPRFCSVSLSLILQSGSSDSLGSTVKTIYYSDPTFSLFYSFIYLYTYFLRVTTSSLPYQNLSHTLSPAYQSLSAKTSSQTPFWAFVGSETEFSTPHTRSNWTQQT